MLCSVAESAIIYSFSLHVSSIQPLVYNNLECELNEYFTDPRSIQVRSSLRSMVIAFTFGFEYLAVSLGDSSLSVFRVESTFCGPILCPFIEEL